MNTLKLLEKQIPGVTALVDLYNKIYLSDGRLKIEHHDPIGLIFSGNIDMSDGSGVNNPEQRAEFIDEAIDDGYVEIHIMQGRKKVLVHELAGVDHLAPEVKERLKAAVHDHPLIVRFERLFSEVQAQGWSIDLQNWESLDLRKGDEAYAIRHEERTVEDIGERERRIDRNRAEDLCAALRAMGYRVIPPEQ